MSVTLPGTGAAVETTTQTGGQRQVISIGDSQVAFSINSLPSISGSVTVTSMPALTGTVSLTSTSNNSLELAGQLQRIADLLELILTETRVNGVVLSSLAQPYPENSINLRGDADSIQ